MGRERIEKAETAVFRSNVDNRLSEMHMLMDVGRISESSSEQTNEIAIYFLG